MSVPEQLDFDQGALELIDGSKRVWANQKRGHEFVHRVNDCGLEGSAADRHNGASHDNDRDHKQWARPTVIAVFLVGLISNGESLV